MSAERPGASGERQPEEQERVVIRDNRKIDPVTGEARKTAPAPGSAPVPAPVPEPDEGPKVDAQLLDERTHDLQRVQAEYANYRKRAERDRLAAGDIAVGRALAELLPILDDIDRARAHGDLTGALKSVAEHLDTVFGKLGLVAFGEVGDPFDPVIHEAVMHEESESVDEPTCTTVLRKGYKHQERLLRPAMVGVTEPVAPPGLGETPAVAEPAEEVGAVGEVVPEPADLPADVPADHPADLSGDHPADVPADVPADREQAGQE